MKPAGRRIPCHDTEVLSTDNRFQPLETDFEEDEQNSDYEHDLEPPVMPEHRQKRSQHKTARRRCRPAAQKSFLDGGEPHNNNKARAQNNQETFTDKENRTKNRTEQSMHAHTTAQPIPDAVTLEQPLPASSSHEQSVLGTRKNRRRRIRTRMTDQPFPESVIPERPFPASDTKEQPVLNLSNLQKESKHTVPSSLYLPSKIMGKTLYCLVDTGCTNSILSKHFFDTLPSTVRAKLKPGIRGATLADGSHSKMYGQITLPTKIRSLKKDVLYQVAGVYQDAILGIDLLKEGAQIDVGKATLEWEGQKLRCTDKHGDPLMSKVQVFKTQVIPAGQESSIACRLASPVKGKIGLVERDASDSHSQVFVAACLVKPDNRRVVPVRCYNPSSVPVTLQSGAIIGSYVTVEDYQVTSDLSAMVTANPAPEGRAQRRQPRSPRTCQGPLQGCHSSLQERRRA